MKLPNREKCFNHVQESEAFQCTKTEVNGFKVEIYNYLFASYKDFFPLNGDNWTELRGLTFVYNPETKEWERHLLLTKFFNLGETEGCLLEDVKDKKISRIQNKFDGSLISFVRFPNGSVRAKSKMSFESDQAKMAQEIYDNSPNLQNAVDFAYKSNHTLIFELISPFNQIVLNYEETDLILLQIRDWNGEYLNKNKFYSNVFDINIAKNLPLKSFNQLIKSKQSLTNKEGWVVILEDGQMLKVKTDWYCEMHSLIGYDALRENILIQSILNETVDDVIAQLKPGQKRDFIIETQHKVNHKFNNYLHIFLYLRNLYFKNYSNDRKLFALKYKNEEIFPLVMSSLNAENVEEKAKELIKNFILKKTFKLYKAKEFLQ